MPVGDLSVLKLPCGLDPDQLVRLEGGGGVFQSLYKSQ